MFLCPNCLTAAAGFDARSAAAGGAGLICPICRLAVSVRYPHDSARYPPLVCCLIALPGHGKAAFLTRLLREFERVGACWPGFSYTPLDEEGLRVVRALQQSGAPAGTGRRILQRPLLVRLGPAPCLGACQLLLLDLPGEALPDRLTLTPPARYLAAAPAVVWLVSLEETSPAELAAFQISYDKMYQALGGQPGKQKLLLVLTKGDRLTARRGLPEAIRHFLQGDHAARDGNAVEPLEELAQDTEAWLACLGFRSFLEQARGSFETVRACVVSSRENPVEDRPSSVLTPLYWLQRLLLPHILLDGTLRRIYFALERAVRDAPPGATLHLGSGDFFLDNPLVIQQPLCLRGSGQGSSRIASDAELDVVYYEGDGRLTLHNLQLRHQENAPAHVVWIAMGEAEFHQCLFTGAAADRTSGLGGCGLLLTGSVRASVSDCRFAANAVGGILATDRTQSLLYDNHLSGGDWGIFYSGSAGGTARRNHCSRTTRSGILVEERAWPTLENNVCEEGEGYGLYLGATAHPILRGNHCRNNRQGDINDQRRLLSRLLGL